MAAGRLGWLLALVLAAGALAGCTDPIAAARGTCRAEGLGERRCRAIVTDAGTRLPPDSRPIVGVEVRVARPEDRDTLRSQTLVATVRFSFLDGSAREVPVYCGPRLARTAVCREPAP